jgi:large subunit ribosomal protein L37Ae
MMFILDIFGKSPGSPIGSIGWDSQYGPNELIIMVKKKEIGSIKRVGVRYGRLIRHKVGKIENATKNSSTCPYCKKKGVKRISAGIWKCSKCDSKFTAGAYSVNKKLAVKGA